MQCQCPFYDHVHAGEAWDIVDEAIMACRDRHRAEAGNDLPEEERTLTTEMLVADSATLIMPCLHCGAVTLLESGICGKCADAGKAKVR